MNTVFRPVNPVLDSLHIQGYCFHQTGWLYKEYRLLLFFAPHIQHAGLGLTLSLQSFSVGVHHPCIPPPHLQSLPFCNTIARPLGNKRPLTDPPFVCREPYNIGDCNLVQMPIHTLVSAGLRPARDAAASRAQACAAEALRIRVNPTPW